jgi:MFS family permease
MFLLGGETVSTLGDAFFNISILWTVYAQSGSNVQTSFVQVVWHTSDILLGLLAGVVADRWDRKTILVVANLLAAFTVGVLAVFLMLNQQAHSLVILAFVFTLNGMVTFVKPARFAVMPSVVTKDLLTTSSGFFSTARQIAELVGSILGRIIVS